MHRRRHGLHLILLYDDALLLFYVFGHYRVSLLYHERPYLISHDSVLSEFLELLELDHAFLSLLVENAIDLEWDVTVKDLFLLLACICLFRVQIY